MRTEISNAGGVTASIETALCRQQHVGGLQIAVHYPQTVHVGDPFRYLLCSPKERPLQTWEGINKGLEVSIRWVAQHKLGEKNGTQKESDLD